MLKIVGTILLFVFVFALQAQEKLMPLLPETDSLQVEKERQLPYQQLLSGSLQSAGLMENIALPEFDFNREMAKRYQFSAETFTSNQYQFNIYPGGNSVLTSSPFFTNGAVFSEAQYKFSDKFSLGGYSFGANSIFSSPLPNQGMNNFDTRGSTLFMQYKVSKNFKIETRVSVSQGPRNGF